MEGLYQHEDQDIGQIKIPACGNFLSLIKWGFSIYRLRVPENLVPPVSRII